MALETIMKLPTGVKVTFQGNVLYCSMHRTAEENFAMARQALSLVCGISEETLFSRPPLGVSHFEDNGGKVELYRSIG